MTINQFIERNRGRIDTRIQSLGYKSKKDRDDYERKCWLTNDETLLQWAKDQGVSRIGHYIWK